MEPHVIKEKLQDRNLKVVSERTGVSYVALTRWLKGQTQKPSYLMITRLQAYLAKRPVR